MLFFSFGILLYPAQNNISQDSSIKICCTQQGACHKDLPQKHHKKSNSQSCCDTTVSVVQFIKQNETISAAAVQKNNFKSKVSFFHSNSILPNTLLEGIWQPPKFI